MGTEQIGGTPTYDWLRGFSAANPAASVAVFCERLASELTRAWSDHSVASVLEILVTGVEHGERLYSPTHGIYAQATRPPVGGEVHVYGVSPAGNVRQYMKARSQVKAIYP